MHACLRRRGWQPKAHCVYPSKEPARCSVLCLCDGRETFAVTDAGADERLKMTPSSLGCCLLLVPSFHPLALAGFAGCVKKFDYSDKDAVTPDSTQMLGYKPPKYYGIGTSARSGDQ